MELIELTDSIIKKDIAEFQQRIDAARKKLATLSIKKPKDWKDGRKLKIQRRNLEGEIDHCRHLIDIATEALEEVDGRV